jgi:glycosyltransferase involved in cell wall biosynthesis
MVYDAPVATPASCPAASIIVNTLNRAPYLQRLLASLDHQQGAAFEVVVVNGPSTDATGTVLARYRDRITIATCDTPNLARSRNIGLAHASGELVLFIDDDALPCDASWVARYVETFARDENHRLAAIGGPVWHRDTESKEFDGGFSSDYAFQVFDAQAPAVTRRADGRWFPRVPGGNCAFRRDRVIEVGGFDEFFTYYLEETDLCARLVRAGYEIAHQPDNGIRHYAAASDRRKSDYDRNWYEIARSDAYFCVRHGRDRLLPLRLARTVAYAPSKHHLQQLITYVRTGAVSRTRGIRLLGGWGMGFVRGAWAGATQRRASSPLTAPASEAAVREAPVREAPAREAPAREARRLFQRPSGTRRLRVAIITGADTNTTRDGVPDLALGLHARGHDIHVLTPGDRETMHASAGLTIAGVPGMRIQPRTTLVINKSAGYALGVVQRLRQWHERGVTFDIVHAVNWDPGTIGILRSGPYPIVLTLSSIAQAPDENRRLALALDAWHIAQAHADELVLTVPSHDMIARCLELLPMDTETNRLTDARVLEAQDDPTMAAAAEALYVDVLAAASAASAACAAATAALVTPVAQESPIAPAASVEAAAPAKVRVAGADR